MDSQQTTEDRLKLAEVTIAELRESLRLIHGSPYLNEAWGIANTALVKSAPFAGGKRTPRVLLAHSHVLLQNAASLCADARNLMDPDKLPRDKGPAFQELNSTWLVCRDAVGRVEAALSKLDAEKLMPKAPLERLGLQPLGPFSCTYEKETPELKPLEDGGCVHCGRQPDDEIHSEKRRLEVEARFSTQSEEQNRG